MQPRIISKTLEFFPRFQTGMREGEITNQSPVTAFIVVKKQDRKFGGAIYKGNGVYRVAHID